MTKKLVVGGWRSNWYLGHRLREMFLDQDLSLAGLWIPMKMRSSWLATRNSSEDKDSYYVGSRV